MRASWRRNLFRILLCSIAEADPTSGLSNRFLKNENKKVIVDGGYYLVSVQEQAFLSLQLLSHF
jgi:hypothetical protein